VSAEAAAPAKLLAALGVAVVERGWLSANSILFLPRGGAPATVVDTGYALHAEQTEQLLRSRLGARALARVVNTHLHSDHCGGNARLHRAFGCETWVPAASIDAVRNWDAAQLTFERTDQRCDRFTAQVAIEPGMVIRLGDHDWQALATPGHDPDALVFFQQEARVLISGDALWQDRLAIVFPELAGEAGFADVRRTLLLIERLQPRLVIPGHGPAFADVAGALAASRNRLESFERHPERHLTYALRALAMFHMLERREREWDDLLQWMIRTPILRAGIAAAGLAPARIPTLAEETLTRLVLDGALVRQGPRVRALGDTRG
jgi:glyoxylase-like metal-dependent hydrolase (beta-lactamase superfamily II)